MIAYGLQLCLLSLRVCPSEKIVGRDPEIIREALQNRNIGRSTRVLIIRQAAFGDPHPVRKLLLSDIAFLAQRLKPLRKAVYAAYVLHSNILPYFKKYNIVNYLNKL